MSKLLLDEEGRKRIALNKDMIVPEHVALILDGNGRWTKKRGLPRVLGHKEECVTVGKTVEIAARTGIRYLTVYGFSTKNWRRSAEEIEVLVQLFHYYMVQLLGIAPANNVQVEMVDDRNRFDGNIIDGIDRLKSEAQDNTGLALVIAVNYGGRDEVRRAAAGLARGCALGKTSSSQVDETLFASHLGTAGMPDPDLLIRTGGGLRLSNYLLWQLAYMEIVVIDYLWPDFNQKELGKAIVQHNERERRSGAVK